MTSHDALVDMFSNGPFLCINISFKIVKERYEKNNFCGYLRQREREKKNIVT